MMTTETLPSLLLRRSSNRPKRVKFNRMYEPHLHENNTNGDEIIIESIPDDSTSMLPSISIRPTIHWGPVEDSDLNGKEQINTDTEQFDALFARSNASSPPPSHPRCYSSCSTATAPSFLTTNSTSSHLHARSQPLLSASPTSKPRQSSDLPSDILQSSNSSTAQTKRKNFSLTHTAQDFLQAANIQNEQLEPLARSCSYKRPQSMKKYRQKKKEKEKEQQPQQFLSARKSSTTITSTANHSIVLSATSDSSRKSITSPSGRVSAADLMATDDHWSSPTTRRSERIGSLPLDQLQLPTDGDEEIYLVRQFHTTSKGFVNRGDSFKRSIKRSGSTSRRNSFRAIANERTSSTEQDLNHSPTSTKELRTSIHSLTNHSSVMNVNGLTDSHFLERKNSSSAIQSAPDDKANDDDDDEDDEDEDSPIVERIQTEDGRLQDIRIYQVYLLGMSGTGKCSLIRQFKSTEYRGIYDYSSSIDDDPDNTVSIMLDGVESRLHIINIDIDYSKISVTGDAFVVVYSITDRQSFQTAVQLIKNIRDNELISNQSSLKRHVPIILVGNKSDLVRKRSVTKETARHAASKYDCKFVETSAAINDKVDDLLAGTLKQIRINEQIRTEQKRRLTVTNTSFDTNDSETPILSNKTHRKTSAIYQRHSSNVFTKFLNVFRKKPSRLPADVENLNSSN